MKLFFCLFSVYILVLAGIPCQADDGCCADEMAVNGTHSASNKTDRHPGYPGPCSPFFACGACHGFVVPSFDVPLTAHRPAEAIRPAIYKSRPLPDFHAAIWQPPKTAIA
ncbi:MAG TPA: hypothetical protein VGS79_20645 [Puia sp.]|nr:hypothetical protein [Puia sp.]